jgi:hypothetical protein
MRITQRGVEVEVADVMPMVDGLSRTPAINPDLGNAAVIAASRYVAMHQDEIKKSLDDDFYSGRWPQGGGANRIIRSALDSPEREDRKHHLATYLRHTSRTEGYDERTGKSEPRRLPFSFDQLPGLIEFYQSRVDIYDNVSADALKPFLDSEAVADEAKRVVEAVGLTENGGDILHAALEMSPMLAEYYKTTPHSEVYSLLEYTKNKLKYQSYVDQLSVLPIASNVPEGVEEESQKAAA